MSLDANLSVARRSASSFVPIVPRPQFERGSWGNYGGTVKNVDVDIVRPQATEDVSQIVAAATKQGRRIRPVATGHSWSGSTESNDAIVDVTGLDKILHIEDGLRADGTAHVTVQAGARLKDISAALQSKGLTFQNLGSMGFQTIGGAVSTNTHGSGRNHGGLATQVARLKMVTADGVIHTLSPTENPELFRTALSGLGLAGIITETTYRAVPAFNIGVSRGHSTLSEMVQDEGGTSKLQQMLHNNEWFSVLWVPYTDKVFYSKGNRTEAPAEKPGPKWMEAFTRNTLVAGLASVAAATRRIAPRLIPALTSMAASIGTVFMGRGDKVTVKKNVHAFTGQIEPKNWAWEDEAEFYIPSQLIDAALLKLKGRFEELRREGIVTAAPFIGTRFQKADDLPMSPAYRTEDVDSFATIAVFDTPDSKDQILKHVADALTEVVGNRPELLRMHIGKASPDSPEQTHKRFTKLDTFVQARDDADPKGIFENSWAKRLLDPVRKRMASTERAA
ncbi:MAG: FAD-binding protein [Myxococcota bacterium]